MKKRILIIDDEAAICSSLTFALEDKYLVEATTDPRQGLKKIIHTDYHVVLLDLKIGKFDGINVLQEIKNINPAVEVIIMTAFGSIMSSVDAIKKGAFTYLTKPMDLGELDNVIQEAIVHQDANQTIPIPHRNLVLETDNFHGIIGNSQVMKQVFSMVEKLKDVDTSVVITGESGTGKELVARAIHDAGKRKSNPFVALNCAAIPETLLEEELFGHKKGTFTGAVSDKIGKFEYANKGTIFLDEIGDMSMQLQAKLLRVLQQKEFTPLGGHEAVELDVRFIAASNKDLMQMVKEKKFREDLYFRLNVFEIQLPPLRQRKQDLPILIKHFIDIFNFEMKKGIKGLSKEAESYMLNYDYPGNVRELINIIEYGVLLASDDWIEIQNLPAKILKLEEIYDREQESLERVNLGIENLAGLTLQEAERKLIKAALEINNGHRKATAAMLGISERGLRYKITEYKLD